MLFLIETKHGTFVAVGNTEAEAKINFTVEFPSEKIRSIKLVEEKVLEIR